MEKILNKFAEFSKKAVDTISTLETKVAQLEKEVSIEKEAEYEFGKLLEKAAKALYDADFLVDYDQRKDFVKKAQDTSFLIKTLIKVAAASDVASYGKVANVISTSKFDKVDPIAARAFGYNAAAGYSLLED